MPPSDHTHELAVRSDDLAHDQDGPGAGDATVEWLDQDIGSVGIVPESLEIGAIGNVHVRGRPCRRRIDQIALGIDDIDAAYVGQCLDLRTQHPVEVLAGEALAIVCRIGDAARADVVDEILLDDREIL